MDSDILDNTILCQDNVICFSGTYLIDLSAGQRHPFDKSLYHIRGKITEC